MKSGYDRNLLCLQIRNLDGVRLLWSLLKNPTDNVQVRCARQGSCAVPPHLWPQSHTFYIVIVIRAITSGGCTSNREIVIMP